MFINFEEFDVCVCLLPLSVEDRYDGEIRTRTISGINGTNYIMILLAANW